MVALVEAMQAGAVPAEPALVLSNRADAGGLQKAADRGVPTEVVSHKDFANREEFDAALQATLKTHKIDIVCLAGFMRIFTAGFVDAWSGKMLNIHPSLLPKHKGLHTHQAAIDAGDAEAGCTVHMVTPDLDSGPILGQTKVPIQPDDTAETLAARVLVEEHKLYPAMVAEYLRNL